jgi:hypothetical protein
MEKGAKEVASQECAHDGHDDIDQQACSVFHDFTCHPADHCRGYQVNDDVHVYLLCEWFNLHGTPCVFLFDPFAFEFISVRF